MSESPTSLKAILSASGSAWGRQVLYRKILTVQFSDNTKIEILRYVLEHFMLVISPYMDYMDNPTLDDKIIRILDTWEYPWSVIINEGQYPYIGYNEHLINLSKFML